MEPDDPLSDVGIFSGIVVNPMNLEIIIGLVFVTFLLMISAFISGSEVAYFSLTPSDTDKLKKKKTSRASTVLSIYSNPERLLNSILAANNFVNVSIIIIATFISDNLFDFSGNPVLGFVIEVVTITFFLLLFGEIIPKVYATRHHLAFALSMAFLMKWIILIFKPLASILSHSTAFLRRKATPKKNTLSMHDLSDALSMSSVRTGEDEKILKGIVKFGNISVSAIMTPRVDIMALNIKDGFNEIIPLIYDSGFSRFPVYSESFDDMKGILYVKDILAHTDQQSTFRWQSVIRPPYFVPETKRINELLKEFQVKRMHMAIVIDEYGGTSGIIALEDILEEIVGEITDETDDEEPNFRRDIDNSYIFQGKTLLNDFFKILNIEEDAFEDVRGESETLAGLLLELTGEIPAKDQLIEYDRFSFKVTSVDRRRIKEIKVTLPDDEQTQKS